MDKKTKEVVDFMVDRIKTQKTMFIPVVAISAFALVGYAAADRTAPVVHSNKLVVPYGTELQASDFNVSDNRDTVSVIKTEINDHAYQKDQIGKYKVNVTVKDAFNNETTKEIEVEVVDNEAPALQSVNNDGYVIDVEANSNNDLKQYIKATDNVDGDVSDFITFDHNLNTTVLGEQVIHATVEDNAGNKAEKDFTFNVGDTIAPEMNLKNGNITVNYGDGFDIHNYVDIKDNYDVNPTVTVEGNVDTRNMTDAQPIKVTATDISGNQTSNDYEVRVADIAGPAITLKSDNVDVKYGTSFDPKSNLASAIDNLDGDVTGKVEITGTVNTNKAGAYRVYYRVTDNAGNRSETSAKINVSAAPVVKIRNNRGNRGTGYNFGGLGGGAAQGGIVGTARSRLGCAYRMGASGPTVFDCSGFTSWVYSKNGKSLPRTAAGQYSGTSRVSKSGLTAGDLVFFAGTYKSGISHVGIYIGGGQFIHAANSKTGVVVSSLNSGYYSAHYAGAGRR
ncbi:NlpC/P60 family protein [uncultured Catenibacterium sp.]|uniref:C40 family peptidase n=1 Tax=uncultured Catenibacterium sp. TaxID=286142 RepID=UPI0025EB5EBF|nr:NlpC/P60 family protein [uncultured Catenibacterium sp.]